MHKQVEEIALVMHRVRQAVRICQRERRHGDRIEKRIIPIALSTVVNQNSYGLASVFKIGTLSSNSVFTSFGSLQ